MLETTQTEPEEPAKILIFFQQYAAEKILRLGLDLRVIGSG